MKVGPFGSQLSGNDFKNEGFWVYNQRAIVDENFSDNTVFIDASKYNSMRAFHVHAGIYLLQPEEPSVVYVKSQSITMKV